MTVAAQARPQNNIVHAKGKIDRSPWGDAFCAFFIAAFITSAVPIIAAYAIEKPIPPLWPLAVFLPTTLIVYLRLRMMKVRQWTESWPTLSAVANSKVTQLLTAAFSIVPMAVAVAKGMGLEQKLPFTLYLYWICGLAMVVFLLIFRATAPVVYRYKSYKDLMECEGGLQVLREDLEELKQLAKNKRTPFDDVNEHVFLEQDIVDIKWLQATDRNESPELYFLMRKYSTKLGKWKRRLLTPLLVIPAFVLITTTLSNTLLVGLEASEQAGSQGGFIPSIYRGVLSLNPFYDKKPKLAQEGCSVTPVHSD
ncbi:MULTISPECIES: hypothetical protein [unclassified Pseudomonas]|uniref:Uncharacterized protein n=1 Tax=Pseudomonas sp. MYb327 TaxID=2745230 RepID=A0AAU8DXG5_9PSED